MSHLPSPAPNRGARFRVMRLGLTLLAVGGL